MTKKFLNKNVLAKNVNWEILTKDGVKDEKI